MITTRLRQPFITQTAEAVRNGDLARDAKRWADAALMYRRHLASAPEDAGIWIQLGHALKEAGDLEEARAAYARAAVLAPADPDPRLHLAHLLKRLDLPRQSGAAFLDLMRIAPNWDVVAELRALGLGQRAERMMEEAELRPAAGRYLEIRDLLLHLEHHATVTGIARVMIGLVSFVLDEMEEDQAKRHHFVCQSDAGDGLSLVPPQLLRTVIHLVRSHAQDHAEVRALAAEARQGQRPVALGAGSVYFIPGAFWTVCHNPAFLARMKADGVRVGAYVYDLIPLTHARYCDVALTQTFNVALAETLPFLDFCLTISAFVADQVTSFLAVHDLRPVSTQPVPLAHAMAFGAAESPRPHVWTPRLDDLDERPFVLCVCTIEARKNHIYLLNIWQRMIDEGLDVPDLVFVGRVGSGVRDLMTQVEATRHLGGRVHILHDLPDEDLTALYERCLFTAFPSLVEGWGLPVGESLSHGKVCAASSASSIPEVGGDLALYFDPLDLNSGYEVVRRLVTDPDHLAAKEAEIRETFAPRGWMDVGRDLFAELDRAVSALGPPDDVAYAPRLPPGAMLSVDILTSVLMTQPRYLRDPLRLMFARGWRGIEPSGTWMQDTKAELRLRTDCAPGRDVVVLIGMSASPWVDRANRLTVWLADRSSRRGDREGDLHTVQVLSKGLMFWIKVRGRVGEGGILTVQFKVDGPVTSEGANLPVAVRLHAIGYAAHDDVPARLDLLDGRATLG